MVTITRYDLVTSITATSAGITTGITAADFMGPKFWVVANTGFVHKTDRSLRGKKLATAQKIVRLVVDELSPDSPFTETIVVAGVHQESVPANVHQPRWGEAAIGIIAAQKEKTESGIHY